VKGQSIEIQSNKTWPVLGNVSTRRKILHTKQRYPKKMKINLENFNLEMFATYKHETKELSDKEGKL
jgi:hypothetical protein